MKEKSTEILIQFKAPPHVMFPMDNDEEIRANLLSICIQPDEGMHMRFEVKVPDTVVDLRPVDMEFHYAEDFGEAALPEAYERLLLDALQGDASLFTRADGIELSWGLIDSILAGWGGAQAPPLAFYERGSWGPHEADAMLRRDGRETELSLVTAMLEDPDGGSVGQVCIGRDVTQLRRVERSLAQAERLSSLGEVEIGRAHV